MSAQRSGEVTFAAVVILIAGTLDVVWGVSALADKSYFHQSELLVESLTTWGWVYLVVGAIQLGVAALVFAGRPLGYALGMFGAFLAILVNFVSIGAYPAWSILLIALNFVVLFLLATNLGR